MADYDVVVIGGGAGGLSAARTANWAGRSVAMVTDGPIGGDCTFTGCVPSKTLLESAARGADFDEAMAAVRDVVARIAATESATVLRGEGIEVIEGRGRLVGGGAVMVDSRRIDAGDIVIATGARPGLPPVEGLAGVDPITSDTLWDLDRRPDSLAIMGGGPIGCEMAQAMARLGVEVTLYEMTDRLLVREEPEASAIVEAALIADGVKVRTGVAVNAAARCDEGVAITAGDETVTFSNVLVATGRLPNTTDLGLEMAGVEVEPRGHIGTNDRLATSVPHVWAVGDVTSKLPFTHAADEMGRIAGWNITRRFGRHRFNPLAIPWVTFTSPEVAHVGVIESDAPRGARVVELPMGENDRAVTAGRVEGFVKIIVAPRAVLRNAAGGKVVGATIVGDRAGEMIHEPTLALRTNMFAGRLAQTVHAYPTWSIGIQKAIGQLFVEVEGRRARPARRGDDRR